MRILQYSLARNSELDDLHSSNTLYLQTIAFMMEISFMGEVLSERQLIKRVGIF